MANRRFPPATYKVTNSSSSASGQIVVDNIVYDLPSSAIEEFTSLYNFFTSNDDIIVTRIQPTAVQSPDVGGNIIHEDKKTFSSKKLK